MSTLAAPVSPPPEAVIDSGLTGSSWPARTHIPDTLIRQRWICTVHYPWLVIRLENAHAVYRLGTCDRGVWDAELVESSRWA